MKLWVSWLTGGGLAAAVAIVGGIIVPQPVFGDGGRLTAETCLPAAPCITEVITTGILPYNQPFIRGTVPPDTKQLIVSVDAILQEEMNASGTTFDFQLPWRLREGPHTVRVRAGNRQSPLQRFTVTKPAVEPQISATRIEQEETTNKALPGKGEQKPAESWFWRFWNMLFSMFAS